MLKKTLVLGLALSPVATFAANQASTSGPLGNIVVLINQIGGIINYLVPIAFALIVLSFFWGLAKFVFNVADEEGRKAGKDIMIYSVIAIFVAASIWGIVRFIGSALGVDQTQQDQLQIKLPTVQGGN